MAAEAEEQARRLTAQAREAQAILESLEAVARWRRPLRARAEADGGRAEIVRNIEAACARVEARQRAAA
eukprot:2333591-Prymnesium_polylepis.2